MIDAMRQALAACEESDKWGVIDILRAAIEAAERQGPNYWQEEARRYAENADYWRGKYEAALGVKHAE